MANGDVFNANMDLSLNISIDDTGLTEFYKTLKQLSKGKDLHNYWNSIEEASKSATRAANEYLKNLNNRDAASSFIKQINALKALSGKENILEFIPKINENDYNNMWSNALKKSSYTNSNFSVDTFKQAFTTLDILKEKGYEVAGIFDKLSDYGALMSENIKNKETLSQYESFFGDNINGDEIKKKINNLQQLNNQAEETFNNFLRLNNISLDGYDRDGYYENNRFSNYFEWIRRGSMTAAEAITDFKMRYAYLSEDNFKSNNNSLGIEQLQYFSDKLELILKQVENTSNQISKILTDGVVTKATQEFSKESSIFENLLKDEESLKSITTLFQKLVEESKSASNINILDNEQFQNLETIFNKIEQSLDAIRKVIADVGDGEEFSPLIKVINEVNGVMLQIRDSIGVVGDGNNFRSLVHVLDLVNKKVGKSQFNINVKEDKSLDISQQEEQKKQFMEKQYNTWLKRYHDIMNVFANNQMNPYGFIVGEKDKYNIDSLMKQFNEEAVTSKAVNFDGMRESIIAITRFIGMFREAINDAYNKISENAKLVKDTKSGIEESAKKGFHNPDDLNLLEALKVNLRSSEEYVQSAFFQELLNVVNGEKMPKDLSTSYLNSKMREITGIKRSKKSTEETVGSLLDEIGLHNEKVNNIEDRDNKKRASELKSITDLLQEIKSLLESIVLSYSQLTSDDNISKQTTQLKDFDTILSDIIKLIREINQTPIKIVIDESKLPELENLLNNIVVKLPDGGKIGNFNPPTRTDNKPNISSGETTDNTDEIIRNEKKKQEAYKATTDVVMYHAGIISKLNKAETNGRFYGSNRGTGYFGTGHYFVDANTKHELDNNEQYSKLPYTSIDISQYDNLFKATTDEIAEKLHSFLRNLTKFTQGDDSYEISELFSQFKGVFGELIMDVKEFNDRLESLKTFMKNSNMEDRSDSVSTQFMKSLGYGGVDTRGTNYADTRYGTVIYDLKEESILQANITDELQKQGQMLEKIKYEKGQVFDSDEDNRIQGIIDSQIKAKEIQTEFERIYDTTKLNAYYDEIDSIDEELSKNKKIIDDCAYSIEHADEEAEKFKKQMIDLGLDDDDLLLLDDDEIFNSNDYEDRIKELEEENKLLLQRKAELEANIDAEAELVNSARERAKEIVEERYSNKTPVSSATTAPLINNGVDNLDTSNSVKELNNEAQAMNEVAESMTKAANAKEEFSKANTNVQASADNSTEALDKETKAIEEQTQAQAKSDVAMRARQKSKVPYINSAQGYKKILSQVGEYNVDSNVSAIYKKNDGQLESVRWKAKRDKKGNILYNKYGDIDYEISSTVISKYEQLEKIITKADDELRNLRKDLASINEDSPNTSTNAINQKIQEQKKYIKLLKELVKDISGSSEFLMADQQIIDAQKKAKHDYDLNQKVSQEKTDAKQFIVAEKQRVKSITTVNRALNRQKNAIDSIERTYDKSVNPNLDKHVFRSDDLNELSNKKNEILNLINKLKNTVRDETNEKEFLNLDKLISEYKDLAKYKLKANNPTKQELSGGDLRMRIAEQISEYESLIVKAKKYGDETQDIVSNLEAQLATLSEIDSKTGKYSATADQYYTARTGFRVERAHFSAFETQAKADEKQAKSKQKIDDTLFVTSKKLSDAENHMKALGDATTIVKDKYDELKASIVGFDDQLAKGQISQKRYNTEISYVFKGFHDFLRLQKENDDKVKKQNKQNDKKQQKEWKETWDENRKIISDYLAAVDEINNFKGKNLGKDNFTKTIQEREQALEKLKNKAIKARIILSEMLNPSDENYTHYFKQYSESLSQFLDASDYGGSQKSTEKYKHDVLNYIQKKIDSAYKSEVVSNYTKRPDDERSSLYTANIEKYMSAIKELENEKERLSSQRLITNEDLINIEALTSKILNLREVIGKMKPGELGSTSLQRSKEYDTITKYLEKNTRISKEAKSELSSYLSMLKNNGADVNVDKIHDAFLQLASAERIAGREGKNFLDILKNKTLYGYAAQLANYYLSFMDIIRYVRQGIDIIKQYDAALVEMKKVSEETTASLKSFQKESFEIANRVGATGLTIQNSTADWMRLGESIEEAKKSAEISNVLLNVSEFESIDAATESLVAASQAYKDLDKLDIVDVLNNIGNNYSISTDGLATALQKSASALTTANNDLNEAVALITAGNVVAQDPDSVGAGIRTISLRITGTKEAKEELAELGEETDDYIESASKIRETVMNATKAATGGQGFDILNSNGNYKSTYEIMLGLSELYDKIVEKDKELGTNNINLLLETIAGKNRSNIAASILQNSDILSSVYEDAQNSNGSAQKELNAHLDSIEGRMNNLINSAHEFWLEFINSETIKNIVSILTDLMNVLTKTIGKFGVLKTAISAISLGTAIKGNGRPKMFGLFKYAIIYKCSLGY